MENSTQYNIIKQNQNFARLSAKQQIAIEMLFMGKTDLEVAEVIEVGRDTIWRWRNHNSDFIAAWNELNGLVWTALVSRVMNLFSRSVEAIEEAIEKGDTEVALALVQSLKDNADNSQRITVQGLLGLEPTSKRRGKRVLQSSFATETDIATFCPRPPAS